MTRVMSEAKMLRIALHYNLTGTHADIIKCFKFLLKEGSDADLMKMAYKPEKEKK